VIFVNIAAYRDPECMPTIHDMFQKARWPEQVAAGVVLQAMPSDGLEVVHDRVRVRHVNAADARGACWARALGYQLWQGERYVLQIDSHMRFAPDWDARLLEQLAACPSPKPLLTTYPPGYEPPDQLISLTPTFLAAKEFDARGLVVQQGLMEPRPTTPKPTAFLAAGFLFGPSAWIREAPYDPHLYFHGEEPTLALRLWTHGWDFFGPTEAIIWHQYGKTQRPLHWEDDPQWDRFDSVSLSRVRRVLQVPSKPEDVAVDIAGYGLGSARTVRQYRRMSGVNFTTQTIAQHARDGNFALAPPAVRDAAFGPEMTCTLGGLRLPRGMFSLGQLGFRQAVAS
jgi:glycosyltransferase involved in cell wall biosynthesis